MVESSPRAIADRAPSGAGPAGESATHPREPRAHCGTGPEEESQSVAHTGPEPCCIPLSGTQADPGAPDHADHACAGNSGNTMTSDSMIAGGVTEPLLAVSIPSQGIVSGSVATRGVVAARAVRAVHEEPKQDIVAGMLYYASSSVFLSGMGVASKMLLEADYPVWQLLLCRSVVIFMLSMTAMFSSGASPTGVRKGLLLLRSTFAYTNVAMFFLSCFYLPLATATTFTFVTPLIVALASPWVLHEMPNPAVAVVIPLCIIGVVLVSQPHALFGGSAKGLSSVGLAIGLIRPLFGAGGNMMVRELRRTETAQMVVLYLVCCTIAFSCIGCALTWDHLVMPRGLGDLALLAALGVCGYCNQMLMTLGLARAKAASVMSMHYFSLVFSQIVGVVVFHEYTTPVQGTGIAVIVLSMLGYLWCEARNQKAAAAA